MGILVFCLFFSIFLFAFQFWEFILRYLETQISSFFSCVHSDSSSKALFIFIILFLSLAFLFDLFLRISISLFTLSICFCMLFRYTCCFPGGIIVVSNSQSNSNIPAMSGSDACSVSSNYGWFLFLFLTSWYPLKFFFIAIYNVGGKRSLVM